MCLLKNLFSVFVLCFLSGPAFSQGIQDPADWTYEVRKVKDLEYELIFHVALKDGWHIFSQKPGDDFIIPTSFIFVKNSGFNLTGKVEEKGKLKTEKMEGMDNPVKYYEGNVDFIQKVKVKAGCKISGEQEYQLCNDVMCLPPKRKKFEFVIP